MCSRTLGENILTREGNSLCDTDVRDFARWVRVALGSRSAPQLDGENSLTPPLGNQFSNKTHI